MDTKRQLKAAVSLGQTAVFCKMFKQYCVENDIHMYKRRIYQQKDKREYGSFHLLLNCCFFSAWVNNASQKYNKEHNRCYCICQATSEIPQLFQTDCSSILWPSLHHLRWKSKGRFQILYLFTRQVMLLTINLKHYHLLLIIPSSKK